MHPKDCSFCSKYFNACTCTIFSPSVFLSLLSLLFVLQTHFVSVESSLSASFLLFNFLSSRFLFQAHPILLSLLYMTHAHALACWATLNFWKIWAYQKKLSLSPQTLNWSLVSEDASLHFEGVYNCLIFTHYLILNWMLIFFRSVL